MSVKDEQRVRHIVFGMKILLIAVCCALAARFAARADDSAPELVDCGKVKIVTYAGTASEDGGYALGWTIRPRDKKTNPVDWSKWSPDDTDDAKFFNLYDWAGSGDKDPAYQFAEFIVDIKRRKFIEIDTDEHIGLETKWSAEANGLRYGLFAKNKHRGTSMLLLVAAGKAGMKPVDLLDSARDAVIDLVQERVPAKFDQFSAVFFTLKNITGNSAKIGFSAENFDNHDDDVNGSITVRLEDGAIESVFTDDAIGKAFDSDRALSKADKELNQVYSNLLKGLPAPGRAALQNEQRNWIKQRDEEAYKAGEKAYLATHGDAEKESAAITLALLEFTQKRAAELKARLRTQ